MRLEYFQLIDRIVDLKLADRKISSEATIPTESTIFEGHFPGYPLMPGVLLIEAMAQSAGWLVVAVNRFERMPFLASVKEAKLRTFALPGERLSIDAYLAHDGSGYAVTEAVDGGWGLAGHAHTNVELVSAARSQLARIAGQE